MTYNWQLPDWKQFSYQKEDLEEELIRFSEKIGLSKGLYQALSNKAEQDVFLEVIGSEVISTSAIEGEMFSRVDVMSSIENNLGISTKQSRNLKVEGVVSLIQTVRKDFNTELSTEYLFDCHKLVFPVRASINVGAWRKSNAPMQIISGAIGKEVIHFEAPPSNTVTSEMNEFIKWFNNTVPNGKNEIKFAGIRSAIAHLYFESIHPFEDGNGRIGRAIAEKALFQTLGFPVLMSLSTILEANKAEYYNQLKEAQRTNQITPWVKYFISVINESLEYSHELISFIISKAKFFDQIKEKVNHRQMKALNKMLKSPHEKFEGGMTAKKYMSINKVSKATATRDLQKLQEMDILIARGGGRSVSYQVNFK